MQIKELKNIDEMLSFHEVVSELYPTMSIKEYETKLIEMIPHNYKQAAVFDDYDKKNPSLLFKKHFVREIESKER